MQQAERQAVKPCASDQRPVPWGTFLCLADGGGCVGLGDRRLWEAAGSAFVPVPASVLESSEHSSGSEEGMSEGSLL